MRDVFVFRGRSSEQEIAEVSNLQLMRFLHLLEFVLYGSWWFIINYSHPHAYNPIWFRLVVVLPPLAVYFLSYKIDWFKKNIESLLYASFYVLMFHNFYAKHMNYNDVAWPLATYITVISVCAAFQSLRALVWFSFYTAVLGVSIALIHNFVYPFYIPGLISILLVMNVLMYYRKKTINELAESKARFEKLFDAVFEGIALHEDGKIIAVNESFLQMFQTSRAQLIGTQIINLVADKSLSDVLVKMTSNQEVPYEAHARRLDGETFPVEISMKRHVFEGREVRMVAVRDMTERYQIESERQKALEAQKAVEQRDQFISIASHELRTPLTPLKLANDILLRIAKTDGCSSLDSKSVVRMLETTDSQLTRLTKLIDDMLDVSRMNTGQIPLKLEEFELGKAINEIVQIYSSELSRLRAHINVRQVKPEITVSWDRVRIEQVFTNLIKNALLYGEGRDIDISVRKVRGNVFVSVRDHGIGIEQNKLNKIFERYERAVSEKHYGGLGLGLYISQRIVTAHSGRIRAKSYLGKGSCFTVMMPIRAESSFISFGPSAVYIAKGARA